MSITSDAGDPERIEVEREDARRWAVRLEGELARALDVTRSQAILLERAEQDRDAALQRLSTASDEVNDGRRRLAAARALLQHEATDWHRQLEEMRALVQRLAAEEHRR